MLSYDYFLNSDDIQRICYVWTSLCIHWLVQVKLHHRSKYSIDQWLDKTKFDFIIKIFIWVARGLHCTVFTIGHWMAGQLPTVPATKAEGKKVLWLLGNYTWHFCQILLVRTRITASLSYSHEVQFTMCPDDRESWNTFSEHSQWLSQLPKLIGLLWFHVSLSYLAGLRLEPTILKAPNKFFWSSTWRGQLD